MATAEEKRLLALYRSYLREHVGQIRADRSAKAQKTRERQIIPDTNTDRRLKPQNLLLLPDHQTIQREETYPRTHRHNSYGKIAMTLAVLVFSHVITVNAFLFLF